jgi:hypothetical protein
MWFSVTGVSITGNGNTLDFDHAAYLNCNTQASYRYVVLGKNVNRNCGLKMRIYGRINGGEENIGRYHLVTNCDLGHVKNAIGPANGFNGVGDGSGKSPEDWGQISDIVVQLSKIHDMSLSATPFASCLSATVRDNSVWKCPKFLNLGALPAFFSGKFYRNKCYSETANAAAVSYLHEAAPWSAKQTITDNEFYFTASSPIVMEFVFSQFRKNGSLVDRNAYYVPSSPTFYRDGLGPRRPLAVAQAAGFDLNGRYAGAGVTPNWPDPANGKF